MVRRIMSISVCSFLLLTLRRTLIRYALGLVTIRTIWPTMGVLLNGLHLLLKVSTLIRPSGRWSLLSMLRQLITL